MTSKFALVIANTEYQDASFAKLTAPGRDAEELAHVLREPELAAFDDVQVLLNDGEGKTRRSIARFFADRKRDDLLLLYFSGHGVRNETGQLFLAANDTEMKILDATGIPAEFVTNAMNNSRSQRQLLILDCCNSGAFAHGSKSAAGVGKSMGIATAFEGSGFGRVVLTATDATQYAWEGDKVIGDTQKSVFTHFLIEGLKGDADQNGDGSIDIDELYDYAYEQVVSRTPKQTPGKWSFKQQGDIVLRENLTMRDVKSTPLPSDVLDLLSHPNSSVRRVGVQDLMSLLGGKHLGLARAAEEKLREIAESDDSLTLRQTASETLITRGLVDGSGSLHVNTAPIINVGTIASIEEQAELKKEQRPTPAAKEQAGRSATAGVKAIPVRRLGLVAGGLLIISLLSWGVSKLLPNLSAPPAEPTRTFQTSVMLTSPTQTTVSQPEQTNRPLPTATSIPPTPTPGIGPTLTGKDGMTLLYVPAGEFTMGSASYKDEKPIHKVNPDAFWIDQTEVTNKMYSLCVSVNACKAPKYKASDSHTNYYGNVAFDPYPVIYVDWNRAEAYCEWADRRLPTEAEWEKTARGTDGNIYPWGNTFDGTLVNFCDINCSLDWANKSFDDKYADVAPLGSYPSGKSIYGALDMAGNVWEWVADWYDVYPGGDPSASSDFGQKYRVRRGGSWSSYDGFMRSAGRIGNDPADAYYDIGFRCAMSATP